MSIRARCGSCDRELLLVQLVQPSQGFRCLFCGFAFAPGYATVAPDIGAQVMVAQAALVTALTELTSMTSDRLRLDRATLVGPVASTLLQAEAEEPGPARRRRANWRPAALPHRVARSVADRRSRLGSGQASGAEGGPGCAPGR
jgi:hypothetical protein